MLNSIQRKALLSAQEESSITIQTAIAGLVRDADHGDELAEEKLRLFLRVWRKTGSPRKAWGDVLATYNNQLEIGEL